ncbi:MAG TPA: EVE domain-containing protein [Blastocatellia bacterium]|nr:EVE domain-containing protein [Blastocatellia bacterium]
MADRWLLKSDPETYGYNDLERDGKTVWDGVTNALALKHLREVKKGDALLVYHTGDEKAIVGLAEATSGSYPDPKAGDPRLVVVDIKPKKRVKRPLSLAEIKAMPEFASFALVRMSRLSVMPVGEKEWKKIVELTGL